MSEKNESKLTVLIVDDNDEIRQLVGQLLEGEGYDVILAVDAEEGQPLALKNNPDLILMDIAMPAVDGLAAIWKMREHVELVEVPIVILSAYDTYDLRAEATSAGCRAYLTKPIDKELLRQTVREILPQRQQLWPKSQGGTQLK